MTTLKTSPNLPPIHDVWHHAEDLTVDQVAALLVGVDPSLVEAANLKSQGTLDSSDFPGLLQSKSVLINAINARKLPAKIKHQAREYGFADREYDRQLEETDYDTAYGALSTGKDELLHSSNKFFFNKLPDWSLTTVSRADLIEWLKKMNRIDNFFVAEQQSNDDYLDQSNKRYAPKLAAAVRAWQSVSNPGKNQEKSELKEWLKQNANNFKDAKGKKLANDAVEDCARVANWNPKGGAPRTPGSA